MPKPYINKQATVVMIIKTLFFLCSNTSFLMSELTIVSLKKQKNKSRPETNAGIGKQYSIKLSTNDVSVPSIGTIK